jgi:hypothetical protein
MKKQMIRILVLSLCICMLTTAFCSCNKDDQQEGFTTAEQTEKPTESATKDSGETTKPSDDGETTKPQDTTAEQATVEYDNISNGWTEGWN